MEVPRNRVSLLGTNWSDFRVGGPSRPVSRPISPLHGNNASSVSLGLASGTQQSWFSPQGKAGRPITPRLNPAAPTFEARSINDGDGGGKDSLSINTDTSTTGSSIDAAPGSSGLLSRFSGLARKGSTGKFNLPGWKKDGVGFFGRKPAKEASSDVDEPDEGGSLAGGSPLIWKDKGSGFFGRGAKGKDEDDEEGGRGNLSQSGGFFGTIGRKKEKEEEGEGKEGLRGVFGRKKTKEDKEKSVGESEGEGV